MPLPKIRKNKEELNLSKPRLEWLFVANFSDGTQIKQTQEDKCTTREDGTGSAFTDVLAREKELIVFGLEHIDGKQWVLVDLRTGNFAVNETAVQLHNQNFEPHKYPLELVYFRETRVDTDVQGTVQDDLSVDYKDLGSPRHYVNKYFIGWRTTLHNKQKQVTLAVG